MYNIAIICFKIISCFNTGQIRKYIITKPLESLISLDFLLLQCCTNKGMAFNTQIKRITLRVKLLSETR
jgi:hypothetical protein